LPNAAPPRFDRSPGADPTRTLPQQSRWRPAWTPDVDTPAGRVATIASAACLAAITGLVLIMFVGASAPNPNTAQVRGPLAVFPALPGYVSFPLIILSIFLEAIGLVGMLKAAAGGWSPDPRKLFWLSAGFVALMVNLTPVASSDTASYAAYGRTAALGQNPYVDSPWFLGDAYAEIVDKQWMTTRSVYGPVATWLQEASAIFGGENPAVAIWFLMVANGAVFLGIGYLLMRMSDDPLHATLLWTANPLLLQQLVAGGHLDTFVVGAAVCAVALSRRAGVAGALAGVAVATKVSAGLVAAGLAFERLRNRDWRGIEWLAAGGGLVVLLAYLPFGPHALEPLASASELVSNTSPWRLVRAVVSLAAGDEIGALAVRVGWPVALVAVAVLLWRRLPPGGSPQARLQFVLAFAWVLVAPWVLPWYLAMAWAFLALLPRNKLIPWVIGYAFLLALLHTSGGHPVGLPLV
jgi:hypothetical protein